MESIVFTEDELNRLDEEQLKVLAEYYKLPSTGDKQLLVDRIVEYYKPFMFASVGLVGNIIDFGQRLLPDETVENPKYGVRIRRAYWLNHKEEL